VDELEILLVHLPVGLEGPDPAPPRRVADKIFHRAVEIIGVLGSRQHLGDIIHGRVDERLVVSACPDHVRVAVIGKDLGDIPTFHFFKLPQMLGEVLRLDNVG
jgi:hypothetical protein